MLSMPSNNIESTIQADKQLIVLFLDCCNNKSKPDFDINLTGSVGWEKHSLQHHRHK